MTAFHSVRCFAPFVAVASLALAGTPAAAVDPDGDPILWWNQVFLDTLPFQTNFQRPSASFNTAMHDAVNAALGRPNYAYLKVPGAAGGDIRAAAAQAAHDTLLALRPAQAALWSSSLATQLALVPDGPSKDLGRATGASHAAAVLALRANDGTGLPTPYTPSGLPGRWAPTPPAFAPAANPWLADVTPWLTTGNDQFRPGPPPALDSAEYTAAFDEVKALGAAIGSMRTADQTNAAKFWSAATGPAIFFYNGINLAEAAGLSTIENAALFARLHVAYADAEYQTFNSVFHYDHWRPVTAIRAADTDGNPATVADPTWTSLAVAPPFPSYAAPSIAIGSAITNILEAKFGQQTFCGTYAMLTRCFASASDALAESLESRIWGGTWFRFDGEAGLGIGEDIAAWTLAQKPFGAIPEPATWAMMIAGFGLVGGVARRRQREPKALRQACA